MQWEELKARLLSAGSARLSGEPAEDYIAKSTAGPGTGEKGRFFLPWAVTGSSLRSIHYLRLKLPTVEAGSPISISGTGRSRQLLRPGLHCPDQAFITVTEGCIFSCRYCSVPRLAARRKTVEEIMDLVESVRHRISAISLTSGVMGSIGEEEAYVCEVIGHLKFFGLPIGVSIYPTDQTPDKLYALGVAEVKFNIEAATRNCLQRCPGS